MESIIRDAIVVHLIKNEILSDDQHGFVPGRDCLTQLLLCMEEWTSMVEEGKNFDIIYIDFSKAFDSVAHERLLRKLENVGLNGHLLHWIRTFLTCRIQCVTVEGASSTWTKATSGIPQGSVLGPLLFVIFINDMPDEVKYNLCKLFADDCKLHGAINDDGDNTMQIDLNSLESWSHKWHLPFNAAKCKVMHFGYSNPKRAYEMNNVILETSDHEKDLGVIIDDSLKFHVHTVAAIKKGQSNARNDEESIYLPGSYNDIHTLQSYGKAPPRIREHYMGSIFTR